MSRIGDLLDGARNVSDGTGQAAADAVGVANSGVINGPVTVNPVARQRWSATILTVGLVILGLNAVGAMRWPQDSLAWLTVIVGAAAVLFGVPLAWIWSARRGTGWPAEVLFAAAMTMALLGAAFVGSGGSWVLSAHGEAAQPDGAQPGGWPEGSQAGTATGEPPVQEPRVRRSGTITLKAGYQVDLDSPDPAWGVAREYDFSSDGPVENDLAVELGSIRAVHTAQFARSTSVTYAD